MTYLLDANVFIQAKNLYYGFDFCPAFWDWVGEAHGDGRVFSIARVRDELIAGSDELSEWATARGQDFFVEPDAAALPSLQAVSRWANGAGYEPTAIATFLQVADYYLVAQALGGAHTVVTHEVISPSTRRIKIPNACLALDVKYVSVFEMLRRERARFVLGTTAGS
jgi:hypothetical protein